MCTILVILILTIFLLTYCLFNRKKATETFVSERKCDIDVTDRPVEHVAEHVAERPIEHVAEHVADHVIDHHVEKHNDHAVEHVVDHVDKVKERPIVHATPNSAHSSDAVKHQKDNATTPKFPALSKFVLKSSIKPCPACPVCPKCPSCEPLRKAELSKYILKTEVPPCPRVANVKKIADAKKAANKETMFSVFASDSENPKNRATLASLPAAKCVPAPVDLVGFEPPYTYDEPATVSDLGHDLFRRLESHDLDVRR